MILSNKFQQPLLRQSLLLFPLLLGACAPAQQARSSTCTTASSYLQPNQERHIPATLLRVDHSIVGSLNDGTIRTLNQTLDDIMAKSGAAGVTAAVAIPGQGSWSAVRGIASLSPRRLVTPHDRFHVGSAGKMFTAVVVMQLVQEGRLKLNEPIQRWFPSFPNAEVITVQHLLSNTSGVYNFNNSGPVSGEPEELIRRAAQHRNLFCPGAYAAYSNTNYVMLGRIIEEQTGMPYDSAVTARIIRPLRLKDTQMIRPGMLPTVEGHASQRAVVGADYSVPFAAGTVTSTALDMVTFLHAVLSGRLLSPAGVEQMAQTFRPLAGFEQGQMYGMGLMLIEMPGLGPVLWHGGSVDGFRTFVGYNLERRVFVAVSFNDQRPAEAAAFQLLQTIVDKK